MLKTPTWYYRRDAKGAPWWRPVLKPLARLWLAVNDRKRAKAHPYHSSLFVISVGNLTLGGSGKTPVAGEILRLLAPDATGLSRGHGGRVEGPCRVSPADNARDVGDEPLMLAQDHPFMIARDRAAGLRALEASGTKVVVVDDAHQNLTIHKDLHILVIDGDRRDGAWPFGDGGIVPYGPMREPLDEGLARADICIVWLPDSGTQPDPDLLAVLKGRPVFTARLTARPVLPPQPVTAFAGIAKPWKFRATLEGLGYTVADFYAFPDHAPVRVTQLKRMERQGLPLITTQKDWVKLDTDWRKKVHVLAINARFDDEAGFKAALRHAVAKLDKAG